MALEQGDCPLSRTTLEEALAIYRALDHLPGVVMALNHLAAVERDEGNYAAARSLVIETTRIWQEAGDLVSVAHATSNLADLARVEGDYAAALSLHQECLSIYSRLGDRTGMAWSLDHQGDLALEQGDLDRARTLYEQALEIFREVGAKGGIARALTDLGNLACSEGAYDKAQGLYAETLTLFSELGETRDITRVLEGIACATADSGKWERALRLAGAAAELRKSFGTPLPPSAKANMEKKLETARARLTSAAAAKAWMEGSRMTPQAVRCVVDLWVQQSEALGRDYRWVQVFENRGEAMGASNPHPHGQIWAGSALPGEGAREDAAQRAVEAGITVVMDRCMWRDAMRFGTHSPMSLSHG